MKKPKKGSVERNLKVSAELSMKEKWRRAMSAVGKFRSGLGDLSANRDDYFVEAVIASHSSQGPKRRQKRKRKESS